MIPENLTRTQLNPLDEMGGDTADEMKAARPLIINYKQIKLIKMLGRGACATVYEGMRMHVPVSI